MVRSMIFAGCLAMCIGSLGFAYASNHGNGHQGGKNSPNIGKSAGSIGHGPSPKVGNSGPVLTSKGLVINSGKVMSNNGSHASQVKNTGTMPHHVADNARRFGNQSLPYGKSFRGADGCQYQYQPCPLKLAVDCRTASYCNWSHYCSLSNGSCGCYCPQACCWYYWYEPYCCYLPVSHMQQLPPVPYDPYQQQQQYPQQPQYPQEQGGYGGSGGPIGGMPMPQLPPGAQPLTYSNQRR